MTLSYSEYDALISLFESYKTPAFLPSLDEIAMFEKDPSRWLRFAIYLSEFSPAPSSDTEHYQAQLLSQFLYAQRNLQLPVILQKLLVLANLGHVLLVLFRESRFSSFIPLDISMDW